MSNTVRLSSQADVRNYLQDFVPRLVRVFQEQLLDVLQKGDYGTVNEGNNYGEISTNMDRKMSDKLLFGINGSDRKGLKADFPHSWSEEQDQKDISFSDAKWFIMLDPIDGTGDAKKKIMPPTILFSLFEKMDDGNSFSPRATITVDPHRGVVVVCDGEEVSLYDFPYGKVSDPRRVDLETRQPSFSPSGLINLPNRVAYEQVNYKAFKDWLRTKHGMNIQDVTSGGAGNQFLQFMRGIYSPVLTEADKGLGAEWFANLAPLTIGYNPQPDWKRWDSAEWMVFLRTLGLPELTDIYGHTLGHLSPDHLKKNMVHTTGTMAVPTQAAGELFATLGTEFENKTGKKLIHYNY